MCYDTQLDYSDLLEHMDSWGAEPPVELANELVRRVRVRMKEIMANIRGVAVPNEYFDYRIMKEVPEIPPFTDPHEVDERALKQSSQSEQSAQS